MVLEECAAAGAVDDRRFARLWSRSRATTVRGTRLIAQELAQRGVARPIIREALTELAQEYDEAAAARAFVEKRQARYRREPVPVQWRRLEAQLGRRGFTPEVIDEVLRACLTP